MYPYVPATTDTDSSAATALVSPEQDAPRLRNLARPKSATCASIAESSRMLLHLTSRCRILGEHSWCR